MSYQNIAGWSQIIAMAIFSTVMIGFIVYALRPGNKAKFEAAARLPLASDEDLQEENTKGSPSLRDEDGQGVTHGRT